MEGPKRDPEGEVHKTATPKGVARIWFRGGPTHFGGGPDPLFFASDPKSQGSPLMYFWLPPDFGGGPGPPPPPWLRPWRHHRVFGRRMYRVFAQSTDGKRMGNPTQNQSSISCHSCLFRSDEQSRTGISDRPSNLRTALWQPKNLLG